MSGIVGIYNMDGEPVDRGLLQHMTDFMTFRGPDEQAIWLDGPVGFGHTMLRTTDEAQYEHQPFTLDGEVWITADCRVDGRAELIDKLGEKNNLRLAKVTDVELILRSYHKWGEECVQHLIGDWAFAIWDNRQKRLFCARDQLGVKPFYYSRIGNTFIFSNTLNCIRQHPKISNTLNEAAMGDFLLFSMNYNVETSIFLDIQKLPGAHTMVITTEGGKYICRYWTLPVPEIIRYKRNQDYIDHFKEVMDLAVADRIRNTNEKIALFYSGGLDSNIVASSALEVARKTNQPLDLQGFVTIYKSLIPDEEEYYSSIAAKALGMPVHYFAADNIKLYEGWDGTVDFKMPEPDNNPLRKVFLDHATRIATHSRVLLTGDGGDEILQPSTKLVQMFKKILVKMLLKTWLIVY